MNNKIIFFGTEDYSLGTLRTLVEHNFPIAAVITKPDAPSGRGQKITAPPVKPYAELHNIPVWQPTKVSDLNEKISSFQPATGVLVAFGKIIPQSTIDLFSPGIINLHPSLLPRWRGPSPIEATISNRDTQAGVTLIQLNAEMDAGPVYLQKKIDLKGDETKLELYQSLFKLGGEMLIENLPDILSGALQPTPQSADGVTYCSLLSKNMSLLDPSKLTASEAEAHVRAHLSFPRSKIQLGEHPLIVTKAHIASEPNANIAVQFRDGNYLVVDELIAPSGKTMDSDTFQRGYPTKEP